MRACIKTSQINFSSDGSAEIELTVFVKDLNFTNMENFYAGNIVEIIDQGEHAKLNICALCKKELQEEIKLSWKDKSG